MPYRYTLNFDLIKQYEHCFIVTSQRLIGHQMSGSNRLQCFKACYGVSPYICGCIWYLISSLLKVDTIYNPKHLLWSLMFMKTYSTEEVLRVSCENTDVKNLRQKVWGMLDYISQLGDHVIVFDRRFENPTPYCCKMTVDGTDFKIRQPTCRNKEIRSLGKKERKKYFKSWYSFKYKGAGLRYEVGVCISTGNIVWVNGPFLPGKLNDIMIFRHDLMGRLSPGEKVEADKGYRGEPLYINTPNPDAPKVDKKMKKRVAARHEHVNHFFKQWYCLKNVFRHCATKHKNVFWSVAIITQICIDMEEKQSYPVVYYGEKITDTPSFLQNTDV